MGAKSNTASFTRPSDTTPYGANDLVANSTTAGSVAALSLGWGDLHGSLRRLRLTTSNATITNGSFLVWLFGADPSGAVSAGDNSALAGLSFSTYDLLGAPIAITLTAAMGSVGGIGIATLDRGIMDVPERVYALIQATAAYTPASGEVFSLRGELWF